MPLRALHLSTRLRPKAVLGGRQEVFVLILHTVSLIRRSCWMKLDQHSSREYTSVYVYAFTNRVDGIPTSRALILLTLRMRHATRANESGAKMLGQVLHHLSLVHCLCIVSRHCFQLDVVQDAQGFWYELRMESCESYIIFPYIPTHCYLQLGMRGSHRGLIPVNVSLVQAAKPLRLF